jgi:hypothetical protein
VNIHYTGSIPELETVEKKEVEDEEGGAYLSRRH